MRITRSGGTIGVKDSDFAHKIFHPAPLDFWARCLRFHAQAAGVGPFVGCVLAGFFRAAGLQPRVRTRMSERTAPLSAADRRWIAMSGRSIAADATAWKGPQAADEAAAFAALFDEAVPNCILDRDDSYYCEGNILVVAQTP